MIYSRYINSVRPNRRPNLLNSSSSTSLLPKVNMENDVGVSIRIPKHPRWSPSPVDLSVSNTLNSPPPAVPNNQSNSSSHPLASHTLSGLGSPLNLSALTPHQLSALGTLNSQLNLGNLPGLTLNSLSSLTANASSTGNYSFPSFVFLFYFLRFPLIG